MILVDIFEIGAQVNEILSYLVVGSIDLRLEVFQMFSDVWVAFHLFQKKELAINEFTFSMLRFLNEVKAEYLFCVLFNSLIVAKLDKS